MSISVTQEEAKFRPVTIVIDDEHTVNMLRYAIQEYYGTMRDTAIIGNVCTINTMDDYLTARSNIASIHYHLEQICKV